MEKTENVTLTRIDRARSDRSGVCATMVGDHCTLSGDNTALLSQKTPKNGLSCKMVLQAVGKVLR